MRCLILSAGQGTRLKPLTNHLPKYALPFGDQNIIDKGIETLVTLGLEPIFVKRKEQPNPNVGIKNFDVPKSKKGDLIETIYNARQCIDEDNFCWTGGEVLFNNLNFKKALKEHKERNAYSTFFHVPNLRFTPRGDLQKDRITKFSSNPKERLDYSFIPFVITNKRALQGMKRYGYTFMEEAIRAGELVLSFKFSGNLWNIDTPLEYFQSSRALLGEYINSSSQIENSRLKGSFVYNSKIKDSNISDSIIINTEISNKKVNRKIIYGGKNGCSVDIPN